MSMQNVGPDPTICILEANSRPRYVAWTDKHGQVRVDTAESNPNALETCLDRLRSIHADLLSMGLLEAPC